MNSNIRKYIYLSLTIITICFIFYNSTRNGTESTNTSNFFTIILNKIMLSLNTNFNISSHFVRKFAHFIEFFLLGCFITLTFESFTNKAIKNLGNILFLALLTPVCDEAIQIFSEGRSSQVTDILLDFSGALTGIIFIIIFLCLKFKNIKIFIKEF